MERRLLTLPSGLRNAIVRYRYEAQIPTENEATRRLIEVGLTAHDPGWRNWRRKKDDSE